MDGLTHVAKRYVRSALDAVPRLRRQRHTVHLPTFRALGKMNLDFVGHFGAQELGSVAGHQPHDFRTGDAAVRLPGLQNGPRDQRYGAKEDAGQDDDRQQGFGFTASQHNGQCQQVAGKGRAVPSQDRQDGTVRGERIGCKAKTEGGT